MLIFKFACASIHSIIFHWKIFILGAKKNVHLKAINYIAFFGEESENIKKNIDGCDIENMGNALSYLRGFSNIRLKVNSILNVRSCLPRSAWIFFWLGKGKRYSRTAWCDIDTTQRLLFLLRFHAIQVVIEFAGFNVCFNSMALNQFVLYVNKASVW